MIKRPPKPASMILNLAPMVDVMMCLIIFFLLAAKLAGDTTPVDLPWAVTARVVEHGELGNPVRITVRRAGLDDAEAQYLVTDWDGQRVVERTLKPHEIESLLRVRAARARDDQETLRCVIRADREVNYAHVEVVLRACGLAKIGKIVFPANKGEEPEAAE